MFVDTKNSLPGGTGVANIIERIADSLSYLYVTGPLSDVTEIISRSLAFRASDESGSDFVFAVSRDLATVWSSKISNSRSIWITFTRGRLKSPG